MTSMHDRLRQDGLLTRPNHDEGSKDGSVTLPLFTESLGEAITATIHRVGGFKKVAGALWPAMKPESAYARLKACLDDGKAEKLSLDEVDKLIALGRAIECHVIAQYLAHAHGYVLEILNAEERARRAKKARRAALLAELAALEDD